MAKAPVKKRTPIIPKEIGAKVAESSIYDYSYTLFDEEDDLKFPYSVQTYRKMSRDTTLAAALTAVQTIAVRVPRFIEPYNETPTHKKRAEFVEQCLGITTDSNDMTQSFDEFLREALTMNTYGFSVHEKVFYIRRNKNGSKYDDGKVGIKRLPIRPQNSLERFEYDKDAIPVDEMLYTWITNTENPLIGDSPLKPLHLPISNIREAYNTRNVIMVKRGALGILSSNSGDSVGSRGVNSKDRERIEKEYQNSYGMGDNQSNVIITDSSVSWQPMSFPTRDLMLFEEVSADFMKVIDNFGLNINLFSREKGSTYENLSQGLKQAYQTTIIPLGEEIAMKYSKLFNLKNGEYLELDYSHIPVLQENEKEKSEVLNNKANATQTLVNAGYTLDEVKNVIPL